MSCCVGQEDATVYRVQELCESRVGGPGLPVPNSAYGLRGRKATLEAAEEEEGDQDGLS